MPGHAPLGELPGAPSQGRRGQSFGPAVSGERIEEGVRRGVVGLARVAHDSSYGREHCEEAQVQRPGQLVQVPGAVDLGAQDLAQPLRSQRPDQAVVQHPGRVHHALDRRIRPLEDAFQLSPVSGVNREYLHL